MTTALLWWVGVLAVTGTVVAVRWRRWSSEQADPSELRTRDRGARLALLPVLVLCVLALLLALFFLAWTSAPAGWPRLVEALPVLAVCAVSGLGTVACLRTMAGRRASSWWLVPGLLPAATGAAAMLGG